MRYKLILILFIIITLVISANGHPGKGQDIQSTVPFYKNPFKGTGEIVYPVEAVLYQKHLFHGKTISVYGKTKCSPGGFAFGIDEDRILFSLKLQGRYGKSLKIHNEQELALIQNRAVHEDVLQIGCIEEKGIMTCSPVKNKTYYKLKGDIEHLGGNHVIIKINSLEDIEEIPPFEGGEELEEIPMEGPWGKISKIIKKDSSPEAKEFTRLAEQLESTVEKEKSRKGQSLSYGLNQNQAVKFYSDFIDKQKKIPGKLRLKTAFFGYSAKVIGMENDGTYHCAKGKGERLIFVYLHMIYSQHRGPGDSLYLTHNRLVIFDQNKNVLCIFGDDNDPRVSIS